MLPLLHLELLGQENERGERQSQAGSDGKSRARRNWGFFWGQLLASLRTEYFCAHGSFPRLGKTPLRMNKPSHDRSCLALRGKAKRHQKFSFGKISKSHQGKEEEGINPSIRKPCRDNSGAEFGSSELSPALSQPVPAVSCCLSHSRPELRSHFWVLLRVTDRNLCNPPGKSLAEAAAAISQFLRPWWGWAGGVCRERRMKAVRGG